MSRLCKLNEERRWQEVRRRTRGLWVIVRSELAPATRRRNMILHHFASNYGLWIYMVWSQGFWFQGHGEILQKENAKSGESVRDNYRNCDGKSHAKINTRKLSSKQAGHSRSVFSITKTTSRESAVRSKRGLCKTLSPSMDEAGQQVLGSQGFVILTLPECEASRAS